MNNERRHKRSDVPATALDLALAGAKDRSGAQACLIADQQGLLFAGTGDGFDLNGLAAFASLGRPLDSDEETTQGATLHAETISFAGSPFHYARVGGAPGEAQGVEAAARRLFEEKT
jgi:hypothetical protein